jgi:hypothetical protein
MASDVAGARPRSHTNASQIAPAALAIMIAT